MSEDQKWVPNPDHDTAEEMVFLFHESIYGDQLDDTKWGTAKSCVCCGVLTNERKDGKPRCLRCKDNLVTLE